MRPHRTTAPGLLLALPLALALVAGGCGGEDSARDEPSKAASACRDRWEALAGDVDGRDRRTNPSGLAPRWNSIAATIDHYAASARGSDCGDTLSGVDESMTALAAFGDRLAAYDMELRLTQARAEAEDSTGPASTKVDEALRTLSQQAPVASAQQEAGWRQARVVELDDSAAVAKAVKDLTFLSSESSGYRASAAALAQIRKAAAED